MYRTRYINNRHEEKRLTAQRVIVSILIFSLMILGLLARVAYLQIFDHQKYATLSDRNQLRLIPIPPPRGLIYDRKGNLLAHNIPGFHLAVIPEQVPDIKKTLEEINKIIPIDAEQKESFLEKVARSPSHQRQLLKLKLQEEEVSRFAVNQYRFPGVFLAVDLIREYPYGSLFAHTLGYVGEATKQELSKLDQKRYSGAYQLGKSGLEKFYENKLQGEPGYQQVETDVRGREVRTMNTIAAVAGEDIHLTLDADLQQQVTKILQGKKGAIIVVNPQNGEILSMVSMPSFDPNLFVRGLNQETYQLLRDAPERPLFNRTIQGQYPPASTIKPIVGLAGLTAQKVTLNQKVFDPGFYQLNGVGRHYRDWMHQGHGWTDFEKSIRESCDIYYYVLAEKMGIQTLSTWLSDVGLGKQTGIDLPGEQKGLVPNASWKKKALGQVWYPGETLIAGIGQGYLLSTPLQLSTMASYIANRGKAFKPHLNKNAQLEPLPELKADKQHWDAVFSAMSQVTSHPRGTATRYFAGANFQAAGKTGTAQVFGLKENEKYNHATTAQHLRDHSLFIGFAPVEKPEIAVVVILENERASAAVARQVMESYFLGPPYVKQEPISTPT